MQANMEQVYREQALVLKDIMDTLGEATPEEILAAGAVNAQAYDLCEEDGVARPPIFFFGWKEGQPAMRLNEQVAELWRTSPELRKAFGWPE